MTPDPTFHPQSAYGSLNWAACRLGRSATWLRGKLRNSALPGFPEPDPITGLRNKADVDAWIAKRRRIADGAIVKSSKPENGGINYGKF